MSDGLDQPRLRLGSDPDEERREDVTELADEPEASPEPEPEPPADAEPEVEEPEVEEPEAESVPEPSWEPEPKKDEEAPAEEDELPRLRGPEHAAGELQIPGRLRRDRGLAAAARGGRSASSSPGSTAR